MELTRVIKSIKEKKYDTYQEDDITITSTENYNYLTTELVELQKDMKELRSYVEKMSYADVVDNPKKDLIKILKKEK